MHSIFLIGLPEALFKALSWTLVHSLWEGLAAALICAGILAATKRANASLRYNLIGMVIGLFLVTAVITCWIQFRDVMMTGDPTVIRETVVGQVVTDTSTLNWGQQTASFINRNADTIGIVWACFFVFNCLRLSAGLFSVNRLRSYQTKPAGKEWKELVNQLASRLEITGTVQLLQSGMVKVPVVIGHLKPVILMPLGLLSRLPAEQVETILIHELAHIRRNDYLVNLMQRIMEAVFFFNPAVYWMSGLLREEREACCDDIALGYSRTPGQYLEALVSFQEYSVEKTLYAMRFSNKRAHLFNRVQRMITRENRVAGSREKVFLFAGVSVLLAFGIANKQPSVRIKEPLKQSVIVDQVASPDVTKVSIIPVDTPRPKKIIYSKINSLQRKDTTDLKKVYRYGPLTRSVADKSDQPPVTIYSKHMEDSLVKVKYSRLESNKELVVHFKADARYEKREVLQVNSKIHSVPVKKISTDTQANKKMIESRVMNLKTRIARYPAGPNNEEHKRVIQELEQKLKKAEAQIEKLKRKAAKNEPAEEPKVSKEPKEPLESEEGEQ